MSLHATRTARLLRMDEGVRRTVYDDATGKPIVPGTLVQGWPTIGVGRNLADPGLTDAEVDLLLDEDIGSRYHALVTALPWVAGLDEVRSAALLSMAFMGVAKLLRFRPTLDHMQAGEWEKAAARIRLTKWYRDVKVGRGERVCAMFITGDWPGEIVG